MKELKNIVLVVFLLFVSFLESKGENYPTWCSLSSPDVIIPWNQSSANGVINITYGNYTSPYRAGIYRVYFGETSLDYSENYPTKINFTASSPGTYQTKVFLIVGMLPYGNWYYGTVKVIKESPPTTIKNSFDAGNVKVGDTQTRPEYPSGTVFNWAIGTSHVLEAFNQNYQAPNEVNYYRVYQNWSRPNGEPNTATNPLSITVSSSGTYTANFVKQFNLNFSQGVFVEGGTGGTYLLNGTNVGSSYIGTMLQYSNNNITAVPPSDFVFINWSDGNTSNPLIPNDHTNVYALYKAHLGSSNPNVTAAGGQRRIANFGNTNMIVYESMGSIWATMQTGSTYSNEQCISVGGGQLFSINQYI